MVRLNDYNVIQLHTCDLCKKKKLSKQMLETCFDKNANNGGLFSDGYT